VSLSCGTGNVVTSTPPSRYVAQLVSTGNTYGGSTTIATTYEYSQWGLSSVTEHTVQDGYDNAVSGSWTGGSANNLEADRTHRYRARAEVPDKGWAANGTTKTKRTGAINAGVGTPTASNITSSGADISCNYTPNTYESSVSAQIQYKRTADSTWINAGTPATDGGYVSRNVATVLTGLDPSTQYSVRVVLSRSVTSSNGTTTGSTRTFTTLAGEPEVTTDSASGIGPSTATLNGTLDIKAGTEVNVHFVWDTTNPPVANVTADQPVAASGHFEQAISGLTASTPYYFKAVVTFVTPTGSPNEGSVQTFNTPGDPLAEAIEEDHVFVQDLNERKYGVATKLVFVIAIPAASSSDRFFNSASPFVAGDVKVAQEASPGAGLGSFSNITNLPTRVGTTPVFELYLTAAEMQGSTVVVMISDQDGPAYRDNVMVIRTVQELGNVDIDASQYANQTAMLLTGVGVGHGLSCVGGASGRDIDGFLDQHTLHHGTAQTHGTAGEIKLATGANANDDYYNGCLVLLVGGTGAGQARVIMDYTGSSRVAVIDTHGTTAGAWVVNPDNTTEYVIIGVARPWSEYRGELSAMPADSANWGLKLQLLTQRFSFKITQTATVQTLFKADSSTTLGTRSVSDDGSTQVVGKLS